MAIVEQFFDLNGKVGKYIYYTSKGKKIVRAAPTKPGGRTEGMDNSSSDFATANAAVSLLRAGFRPITKFIGDNKFDDRLKSAASNIIHSGTAGPKGQKRFEDGDLALLKQLEFNCHTATDTLALFEPAIVIDPAADLIVSLPKMPLRDMFNPPGKAVAAVLQFLCCIFYFDLKKGRFKQPEDLVIPWEQASWETQTFQGGKFRIPMEGAETSVLVVGWSVSFKTKDGLVIGDRKYYAGQFLEAVNIVDGQIVPFQPPPPAIRPNEMPPGDRIPWEMDGEELH